MDDPAQAGTGRLVRRLGVGDAVLVGLGAMIGAGVFVSFAPAAAAAGAGLLVGLAIAAVVAFCNATSSARLAARYPTSGGTYVYGREQLGPFWGYLAGWAFVVGKTASCAAMALTVGTYVWPSHAHVVAVLAVVALTSVNYVGLRKAAWLTRVIVAVVLAVLVTVVVVCLTGGGPATTPLSLSGTGVGVVRAAGLLFFAFAGYARITTLAEEVRDPVRTIPRAIPLALAITLVVYAAVAVALLTTLGPARLAASVAPLADAVRAVGMPALVPVVTVGAAVAALGALLALILGVSRTVLAMARDRYLPTTLAAVHPRFEVPHHAELAVGAVVALAAGTADPRAVIGFSSFGVLLYYAIGHVSAWTLTFDRSRRRRIVPGVGLVGCLLLAFALPWQSVLAGAGVMAGGAALYAVSRRDGVHRSYVQRFLGRH